MQNPCLRVAGRLSYRVARTESRECGRCISRLRREAMAIAEVKSSAIRMASVRREKGDAGRGCSEGLIRQDQRPKRVGVCTCHMVLRGLELCLCLRAILKGWYVGRTMTFREKDKSPQLYILLLSRDGRLCRRSYPAGT